MGSFKSFVPVLLALVIALGGSWLVYNWLDTKTATTEVVEVQQQAVPVVVSVEDLSWGTKLEREMLKTVPFLEESLPRGYVSDPAALEGRVLTAAISANDPVTQNRIAPDDVTVGGVSAVLPPGKRAVAVQGDKVIGISGFIRPGHVVDVLVTLRDPDTGNETTKLVLERIPVLATGTEIKENEKGQPAPVDVYTLQVTPGDAEKLTLASTRGMLRFALRNITDGDTIYTRGATISDTLRSLRAPEPVVQQQTQQTQPRRTNPAPRRVTVQQIQGDSITERTFTR